jgi:hypothetical protein
MTKIIIRNDDSVVVYAGDDIALSTAGASGSGWIDPATTTANATLASDVSLPAIWASGAYAYASGAWSIVKQSLIPVPQSVTPRQARLALLQSAKLAAVDAAIAALPDPQKSEAQIEWEYARDIFRDSPLVKTLGAALGMDDADMDGLFIAAVAL